MKTHCKNGHAFDEANTYHYSGGRRRCRACQRDYQRRLHGHAERRSIDEHAAEIREAREAGESVAKIAARLGFHRNSVYNAIARLSS